MANERMGVIISAQDMASSEFEKVKRSVKELNQELEKQK